MSATTGASSRRTYERQSVDGLAGLAVREDDRLSGVRHGERRHDEDPLPAQRSRRVGRFEHRHHQGLPHRPKRNQRRHGDAQCVLDRFRLAAQQRDLHHRRAGPAVEHDDPGMASATVAGGAGPTYTVTFPTGVTSISLGSSGSPVQFSIGNWKPAVPLGNAFVNGYITTSGGSGACASNPCLNVTSIQTGAGTLGATFTGTYNPALTTNNLTVSGITGTLQNGMLITDGGVSLSAVQPLLLTTATCTATCTAYGGYYPSTIGPESMTATLSTVNPGQLITGPGVSRRCRSSLMAAGHRFRLRAQPMCCRMRPTETSARPVRRSPSRCRASPAAARWRRVRR
jgi:hypothetical protein